MLTPQQQAFRNRATQLARKTAPQFGLDWRLLAAAAILETGWGESELARKANNLFGIKATASTPPEQVYRLRFSAGYVRFRRYANEEESFVAYGRLLSKSSYYARPRQVALESFVRAMAPVYCPDDADYALKMLQIIAILDPLPPKQAGPQQPQQERNTPCPTS